MVEKPETEESRGKKSNRIAKAEKNALFYRALPVLVPNPRFLWDACDN
jgi:hypothetical protein